MEIQTSTEVLWAVTFSADAKHIMSGGKDGIRVWQVEDRRHVETMLKANEVWCVAVSQDGRWIAAGTGWGHLHVWDAATYGEVLKHKEDIDGIDGVDFSPNSMQLVTASLNCTAAVWDVENRQHIRTLRHDGKVIAAKYSPQGDRIATATYRGSVHVWDSNDGSLLIDIPVQVSSSFNRGLVWFDDHLLVISDRKIKSLDPFTGSTVVWPEPSSLSCIALSKHARFIAYSTNNTVTLCDPSSQFPPSHFQHHQDVRSIAFTPDGRLLAVGGQKGSVIIQSPSRFASIPPSRLHPTLQEPVIQIGTAILDSWKHGRLKDADALLTTAKAASRTQNHHLLACRALVRARLRKWDAALANAEKAIKIEPSVIGYIAKSIAHVGKGDRYKACRSIDIAIERFHSSHATFLLLIKAIVVFMAGEHMDAISRMDDLIATVPRIPIFYSVQAYMYLLIGDHQAENGSHDDAIRSFNYARGKLPLSSSDQLSVVSLISGWKFDDLDITLSQRLCEALYSAGRTKDAGNSLLEMVRNHQERVYTREAIVKWVLDFTERCLCSPECHGSTTLITSKYINATKLYNNYTPLLKEWARAKLTSYHWRDALAAAADFIAPKFVVYRTVCDRLEAADRIADATECLLEMAREVSEEIHIKQLGWIINSRNRFSSKLEELGNLAMHARQYDTAVIQYSAALSLDPADRHTLFAKRSQAYAIMGLWRDSLEDANQIIVLRPSSPLGYERKYVALRVGGSHRDAEDAFKEMLSKISEAADPEMREHSRKHVEPVEAEAAIREVIHSVIQESPLVLINTDTGRLLDKPGQASSFESQPIFHELVCSTTTQPDHPRIEDEVREYYRYATFSHKWKAREPVYNDVIDVILYELEASPTHDKLQNFCRIVRNAGLHWAWSDTVCINKSDPSVLQEALVSMFQWYQSSALTVVLLCEAPWKCLVENIWNTRAWTFQEYHASKAVRFYNHDWMPYRGIDIPNHKEAPEIIAEMEEATGISAQALIALRPGLEDIREKLRLASARKSTRIEDAAYSLLGIFSLSMTVEYGEGDKALGRLLAQLLMSSGDTSILAWTGRSGSFNSCLPAKISVFSELPTSHIPLALTGAEVEISAAPLNLASVTRFYDQLMDLPVPSFNGRRMKLPTITFKLDQLSVEWSGSERVFRAQTAALGIVEIKTEEDLTRFNSLTFVHPWIDFLLDRQPVGNMNDTMPGEITDNQPSPLGELPSPPVSSKLSAVQKIRTSFAVPSGLPFDQQTATHLSDVVSFHSPSTVASTNRQVDAFRVLTRLRQPFGALLLTPDPGNVAAYRRVATESLITVQVKEITPAILDALVCSVRVLDVL